MRDGTRTWRSTLGQCLDSSLSLPWSTDKTLERDDVAIPAAHATVPEGAWMLPRLFILIVIVSIIVIIIAIVATIIVAIIFIIVLAFSLPIIVSIVVVVVPVTI